MTFDLPSITIGAAGGIALYAAGVDLTTFRIPNWVSIAVAMLFALIAIEVHLPLNAFLLHLATGAAMLLIGMALFAWGKIGGGDAKLLAAVSLWFGWPMLMTGLLIIAVFGAVVAVLILVVRQTGIRPWLAAHGYNLQVLEPTQGLPYGIAIAAGFVFLIIVRVNA